MGEPYDGDDITEMELAIYRGHGVSASAGIRQILQAKAAHERLRAIEAIVNLVGIGDDDLPAHVAVARIEDILGGES